jgi:phospholipid/cholesterol/gamma-HCH transport system substrate-binding protein
MPPSKLARELSVGVVIAAGLIVFAVAVLAISEESRMFQPKIRYWTSFENTSGLVNGSPVRLIGVQVGTVDNIEFPKDLKENKIKVEVRIDRAFAGRIRRGTVAYLKSLSYLSQDKYIELTPGDPAQSELAAGDFIESGMSAWETTLQQSQSIADDVKEITSSLRDLLVAMNRGQGLVQEMIHNPEFGRQGVENFEASLASLRRLLEGIEEGRGLAGTLLRDREFARTQLESISESLKHVRALVEKADDPQGTLVQLTSADGKGAAMLEDARSGAAAFRSAAEGINEGKGVAGRLLKDDAYADDLLKKMKSAAGHIDSILAKIDKGDGTIGGLVNDPDVYQGLRDIVAGMNKSKIGKGILHHYGKKGAETREEGGTGEEQAPPAPNP